MDVTLIEHIKDKLVTYKNFNSLSHNSVEESSKSLEIKQLEFKILAAEIDCLAGLLKAKSDNKDNFLGKHHNHLLLCE